jgi:hypothetical protein
MNWTISCGGTEKLLADWGLTRVTRKLVSQGMDELTFKADGTLADAAPLFPFRSTIVLWRNRAQNGDGSFSGGTSWFQGLIIQVPRAGAPDAESMMYKAAGPWWYLDNLVFQQPYEHIFLGFAVAGDPESAIYGEATSSHLFLNQGDTPGALTKITTGLQIIQALNWALLPFVNADVTPAFQIGNITPSLDVPIDEVRDITCAEVIHKMLRWSPDAVTWFDYTTTPPTFNCVRRADMSVVNLDLSGAGIVRDLSVNARYDLQAPSVQIFYETITTVNGQESLSLVKDFFPNPLPTAPAQQFAALQFTVDLQGISTNVTSAKIAAHPLDPTDPDWWLARHPQYTPWDPMNPADADNNIASFTIDATTIERSPNPAVNSAGNAIADKGYTNELTSGQLADWMPFGHQRLVHMVKATIVHRNGTAPQEIPLTFQCVSTNATSGTYYNTTVTALPEPVPVGLAQYIYEAISVLQFEGRLTLQEPEVSGSLLIGQLFNLVNSANSEWTTMAAMVQEISENLDAGATMVQFGPPRNLSAGELVDLLRVNRARVINSNFSMRSSGTPGNNSGEVDLGQQTPEKNSVSGTAPANPQVVSNTVDGSGAVISHNSTGSDCASTWIGQPGPNVPTPTPGSIVIQLSAANGQKLTIQPLPVCLNGVAGTMYFLCSAFIPNP